MRHIPKIIGFGTLGILGSTMFVQKQYIPQSLLPISHMLNIAKAGVQMAVIYKYSNKTKQQKHIQASQYMRLALNKNGGIYIKLGQLIATLDVIVPDEYRNTMLKLTRGCQKSSYSAIKQTIQQQTGKPLEQTFAQFQKQPISSASIAQVHRGRLKTGEQVAVKIQHANLSQNVIYDIELMWLFVKIGKTIFKDFKFQWLIQQFQVNILRQLDFRLQAVNMKRVKQMLINQKFYNVTVPKLLLEPSKKLLIMQYIHGYHIDETDKMQKAKINMKKIGKTFSQVIIKMIHKYGFVHADPHSGNLLVRKKANGQDQLVLLDHGLYQELDQVTKQDYNWFWLGLILNKQDISVKAANRLGTKNGTLLCCMLTSQTRQQLLSPDRNIFDLNPGTDKYVIMKHAKQWHEQIVVLLNQIKRSILLLLKVNQFARSIENMLGGRQMGVYQDIAFCCVDNLPISRWQRWRYKIAMMYAYMKR